MKETMCTVCGILMFSLIASIKAELLHNNDFETTTYTDWFCPGGCLLTPSQDAYQGQNSVKVSNRQYKWSGAAQTADIQTDVRYKMTGFVKFLSTKDDQPFQDVGMMVTCKNSEGVAKFYEVGNTPRAERGEWNEVGGIVSVPAGSTECKFYVVTDAPADYLLDTTSLKSLELLKNPNFESATYGDWFCMGGCRLTPSQETYQGQNSVLVSERTKRWNGAAQNVDLQAGSRYRLTAYVNFVTTTNSQPYQEIGIKLNCRNAEGAAKYYDVGSTPRAEPGQWHQVGGAFKVPEGSTDCKFYFQTESPATYLLDKASLEEVSLDADWKTQAETTIDEIRKATTNIRFTGTGLDNNDLQYEIVQTGSEFIWGSAVGASEIVDSSYSKYQEVFNENFEWAVLENSLKWDEMEPVQGQIDYATSLNAIAALQELGKRVRGHCAFWSVDSNVQNWVKGLSGNDLEQAVSRRIEGLIGQTKGLLEHWDVNNENQHGDFYERQTSNTNITQDMFKQIRLLDRNVRLYLNDFGLISSSSVTVATKDQAERFLGNGIPLGGIGVQGHVTEIDLALFKARLDLLAETGLPILITELGVNDVDVDKRASTLSDLLYLLYSHPSVEGVIFWGFWDGKIWEPEAPLFNGENVEPNAAGLVYQNLRQQWTSKATGQLNGNGPIEFTGFMGSYSITIKQYGNVVATQTFDLSSDTTDVDFQLDVPVPVVRNDRFESTDFSDNWFCRGGCSLVSSTEAHEGDHSVLVTSRTVSWHGLAQNLDVTAGSRYIITAYVNIVKTADSNLYEEVGISMTCKDAAGDSKFFSFGKTPRAEPGVWYEIGGAQRVPEGYTGCMLYILSSSFLSDYLIDSVRAEELSLPSDWKTTATDTIDDIRKDDITIRVTARSDQLDSLSYELVQTGHEFVWGSAVNMPYITDTTYTRYQEVFYENFEWGVLGNALKWKPMERRQGIIDYETGLTAIEAMRSRGKKIRGHAVFWAVDKHVPDWALLLEGQELEDAISLRIQGVVDRMKGLVEHWDVNNEDQHGDFFERSTRKTNITMEMFEQVHEVDSDVRLYLNDFGIISSSSSVVANKDQAVRMVKNKIPISGIGVQGHMKTYDMTLIKGRLDILAEAGLPILITELGVNEDTAEARASKLSDLMYMFFSHPSVEGLVLWGFWDGRIWEEDAPLFNGPDVLPNAAGLVYQDLRRQWTTNVTDSFNGASSVTIRGFRGDYSLRILQSGNEVTSTTFSLKQGGATVDLDLS